MRVAESYFLQCWDTAATNVDGFWSLGFHSDSILHDQLHRFPPSRYNLFLYGARPFRMPSVAHATPIQQRRDTRLLQRTGASYPSLALLVTLKVPD